MTAIEKANPDVKIVYKEFPIRGPVSEFAARAAIAANLQGKYKEFSHALLTSNQPLTNDTVLQIAQKSGLNVDKLKQDMDSKAVTDQLKGTMELAQNLKLFGTPALFIAKSDVSNNGGTINYIPGQMNQAQLQSAIDQANK
jgi:protein-disulfide isomerase